MRQLPASKTPLRSYELPLRGRILLACGKCQRKLKDDPEHDLASLKKLVKKAGKEAAKGEGIRMVKVPCLKMCPKAGITVMTPAQVGRAECSILCSKSDVATLCENMLSERQD